MDAEPEPAPGAETTPTRGVVVDRRRGGFSVAVLPTPSQLVSLILVLLLSYLGLQIVRSLRTILVMLLVSLFVAFAMEPAVQWLGHRGWTRGSATGVVFVGVAVAMIGAFASIVPLVISQAGDLIDTVPTSVTEINEILASLPLIDFQLDPESGLAAELSRLGADEGLQDFVLGAAGNVVNIGATAIGLLFQGLTVLLVSFYLVVDGPRFRATLARPLRPARPVRPIRWT